MGVRITLDPEATVAVNTGRWGPLVELTLYTGDRQGTRQFQTSDEQGDVRGDGEGDNGDRISQARKNLWHAGNDGFKIKYIL